MHVPIHNESEIFVYKHWVNPYLHLYKNSDDAFEAKEELKALSTVFDGVFLSTPIMHRRDERNLETLYHIAPSEDFIVFAPPIAQEVDKKTSNCVFLCNYLETSPDKLQEFKQKVLQTVICLNDENNSSEPFELANQIANLMDVSGGGDYVHIASTEDDDYVIRLCEELSYLDVPGPTMKSRLILDCSTESSEELVDEVMMMGVNKFVLHQEEQLQDCIQTVAEEQGKQLVKSFSE